MAASASPERTWRWRGLLSGLLALLWASMAAGHPMPQSQVWIDTTDSGLRLTMRLPLVQLEPAFGRPLADIATQVLPRYRDDLVRYLQDHVGASSSGQRWTNLPPQLQVDGENASAELVAMMDLQAPAGADARTPTLLFDAINHEVRTHRAEVFLRNDWAGGFAGQVPLPLGELHHGVDHLVIPLGQAHSTASLRRLWVLGAEHIAAGTDHLLFLLMLVVVAPLRSHHRRWAGPRAPMAAVKQLVWVVSAFTLGHSVTLALGSWGLPVPQQPTEVAIALSIAVAAVHALRPLWRGGELRLAAGFGLVHGLAFSASLSGAGLSAWQHLQALLAFNLGIEAMQLAVLAVAAPPLLVLARCHPAAYARLRQGAAGVALTAAGVWAAERLGIDVGRLGGWVDLALSQTPVLALLLWCAAALALWRHRGGRGGPARTPA